VVIFGSDRAKFGEPDTEFATQTICATGKVEEYRGVPQIVATDPKQIEKKQGKGCEMVRLSAYIAQFRSM
jgi:hypothetical protein